MSRGTSQDFQAKHGIITALFFVCAWCLLRYNKDEITVENETSQPPKESEQLKYIPSHNALQHHGSDNSWCERHHIVHNKTFCPITTETGDFRGTNKPFYFYSYSAYYDLRFQDNVTVVVNALLDRNQLKNIGCSILMSDASTYLRGKIVRADQAYCDWLDAISDGTPIAAGFLQCQVPRRVQKSSRPLYVKLVDKNSALLSVISVETPKVAAKRQSIGLCLPVVYQNPYCSWCKGLNYTYHLPEWIEMHRLLGVEKIFVYNNSFSADAEKIFVHYAKEGIVDILSHFPINGEPHLPPPGLSVTDCMYRNMFLYDYLISVDTDEFIIPHTASNYPDMIQEIFKRNNKTIDTVFSINFLMQYYYGDDPKAELRTPDYLKTITDIYTDGNIEYGRGKSLVNPRNCFFMHVHGGAQLRTVKAVGIKATTADAMVHHYKDCDAKKFKPPNCVALLKTTKESNHTGKFLEPLIKAVQGVFHQLQLWGY